LNLPQKPSWSWVLAASWVLIIYCAFFLKVKVAPWPNLFLHPTLPEGMGAGPLYWAAFLSPLGTGLLVFGVLWSLGRRLRAWLSLPASPAMGFCLDLGFGIVVLNLIWMGLGLARLWMGSLLFVGSLGCVLLLSKDLLDLARSKVRWKLPSDLPLWALIMGGAHLCFLFPHAFLPETFYDPLNYFLGMPAFWLHHHGLVDEPGHILSGYFHGGSLFFINGFVLADTEGAKMLGVLCFASILLAVYAWGRELAGVWAGAAGAAAASCFPLLLINAMAVRVDALLSFLLFLSAYCLFRVFADKGRGWPIAFALLAGCALTVKPTAVVLVLCALLAFLWTRGRARLPAIPMAALAGLQVAPWLLKNWAFAGNPFFPYAVAWWGGRTFPLASQERLLHENQRFLPMDQGLLSVLDLPWRLTMPGAGDDQFLGPLLLAFLPILFLLPSPGAPLLFLRRTLGLALVGSLCLSHMLRFSLPAFLLAVLLIPVALTLAGKVWRRLFSGAVIVGAVLLGTSLLYLSQLNFGGWDLWTGRMGREAYLEGRLESSYHGAARWIGDHLPRDTRLLLVGDSRGVYLPRPFLAQSVFDEPFLAEAARQEGSEDGILRRLKRAGVTHLMVNREEGLRNSLEYRQYELSKDEWGRIDRFVHRHLRLLASERSVLIYEVGEGSGPAPRPSNPICYFSKESCDYLRALRRGDPSGAKEGLSRFLALFPGEAEWMARRARPSGLR